MNVSCIKDDFSLSIKKKLFYPDFLTWITPPVDGEREKAVQFEDLAFLLDGVC